MTKTRNMRTGYGRTVATFAACFGLSVTGSIWAEEEKGEQPLCLELALVDGSRVIGVPSIKSVPVETSYAKMDVPLKQIRTIKIDTDHERASLDLQNGDKFSGVINLAPIKLQAIFGDVAVGIEHVKEIGVVLYGRVLPESLKKGLVLYYSFDRDEGEKVTDGSSKGNDGQMNNAKVTPKGKTGWACEFDGQAAVVNAGHDRSLDITRDLTISMWVFPRRKTFGDQQQVLVGKFDGADDSGMSYVVFLLGGTVYFNYGKGPGNGYHRVTASGELGFEKWHHIVAVHKTGVGNSLYADGKLVAEDSEGSALPSNPNTDVILGDSKRAEPWFFYGALDDVMIFDTALSESDVRRIHGP